jgi:predicted NUDIX family NTP pyrophosphohydrolase
MVDRVLHGDRWMAEPRPKLASGTVLYRVVDGQVEVLLVHPAGNYNRRAPWGIPKGAPNPDEELEATARRETLEETGLDIVGPLVDLGHVDYTRSKKRVHAYAGQAPAGAKPRCASWEVDKVEFIEITRARRVIHPDQAALLDRLQRHLGAAADAASVEKTTA